MTTASKLVKELSHIYQRLYRPLFFHEDHFHSGLMYSATVITKLIGQLKAQKLAWNFLLIQIFYADTNFCCRKIERDEFSHILNV